MLESNLRISAGKGLFLLVCWWVLLTVAGSLIMGFIGSESTASLRWMIVVQDLAVFILPVVLTVIIASTTPWRYICIDTTPSVKMTALTTVSAIVSIPAMNRLVACGQVEAARHGQDLKACFATARTPRKPWCSRSWEEALCGISSLPYLLWEY